MSNDLTMMLLSDARLPTGGHSQSAGLEPALLAGMPAESVTDYLQARLHTVVATACAVAGKTAVLIQNSPPEDGDNQLLEEALVDLWFHYDARTPSHIQRNTECLLGRGYKRMCRRLVPQSLNTTIDRVEEAYGRQRHHGQLFMPRCMYVGILGGFLGLSKDEVAWVIAYDDIQTVLGALLKLDPLDPLDCTVMAAEACEQAQGILSELVAADRDADIPCLSGPQIEEWAHQHHHRNERLFHA